jgi:hypothetical protein
MLLGFRHNRHACSINYQVFVKLLYLQQHLTQGDVKDNAV